ncbi:MAG: TetR/AcrR family transcriptional regulator [Myxococcota bacterium]|jgi:AcrR family transcriptional regulator
MSAPQKSGAPDQVASRSARAEASRQRILDAAARCFVDVGYQRTRFEDVASLAGVSRALVYNYFDSKPNLLTQVRDRALAGWQRSVAPEIARSEGAAAKLRAMIQRTLLYARTRPLLQAILADDVRVAVLGSEPTARGAIDAWRQQIAEILRSGVEAGEFHPGLDVSHSADVLRAMQMGVIDRMHRPDGPIDVSSESHVAAMVEIVLRGVTRDQTR